MYEAGKYYRHGNDPVNIYKAERVEQIRDDGSQYVWWSWNDETRLRPYGSIMSPRYRELNTEVQENGEPITSPETEASRHAVVYMAYTQSRNTNTVTIVSHTDEERFNSMLRAHELQGFRTLAKKKIKFTI